MKSAIWPALALALAAFAPAACSEAQPPAAQDPEAPEGIAVTNGRLMLPAVAGNPAAVYFDLANTGSRNRVIRAASVTGAASTTMHMMSDEPTPQMQETAQIMSTAGETVKFEPGGLHLMVDGLAETVAPGGEAEATLTFVGGDKVSVPLEVRAAGDER